VRPSNHEQRGVCFDLTLEINGVSSGKGVLRFWIESFYYTYPAEKRRMGHLRDDC
jgi:hypothetical protein